MRREVAEQEERFVCRLYPVFVILDTFRASCSFERPLLVRLQRSAPLAHSSPLWARDADEEGIEILSKPILRRLNVQNSASCREAVTLSDYYEKGINLE